MQGTRQLLVAAAVAGASSLGTPVLAEETGAIIEEIVVTAQKRAENLQEIPVAITAFDAGDIEDRGVTGLADLLALAPGVTGYEAPSSRGNLGVNIRGVGSGNANSISIDPANAVYIDGVYLGKAAGNGVDAIDLARIEVLRGPQGTLYGRNSTGGAINFITRKPGDELTFGLKASAGDYNYRNWTARLDLPLGSRAGLSLSGYTRDRDPLYDNTRSGGGGFEDLNRQGLRFAVRFDATETFTLDYAFSMDELDEGAQALDLVGLNPSGRGVLAAAGFPGRVTIKSTDRRDAIIALQGNLPFLGPAFQTPQVQQLNQWMTDYIEFAGREHLEGARRPDRAGTDEDLVSANEVDSHQLTLTWQLDDWGALGDVEFKSVTAWRRVDNRNLGDLDGMDNSVSAGTNGVGNGVVHDLVLQTLGGLFFGQLDPRLPAATQFQAGQALVDAIRARGAAPAFNNFATIEHEQFSQELQMVGSTGTVDYAVGLYHYEDEGEFRNNRISLFPVAFSATSSHDNGTSSTSVYGQATWTPDDGRLSYTLGLRYTEEEKDIEYLWRSSEAQGGFIGLFLAGQSPTAAYVENEQAETQPEVAGIYGREFSKDFGNVTGKFTLAWRAADDLNLFATLSRGYRSGGFNGDFFDRDNNTADAFDEEVVDSLELGVKSDLWDGRGRLNVTAFAYDYSDLQVSQLLPQDNGSVTSSITNAGAARRRGLEIEFMAAPVDNLLLSLAYTAINGDFDAFPPVVASPLDGGASLNTNNLAVNGLVPDSQFIFALDWAVAEGDFGALRLVLNGSWQTAVNPISLNTGNYDTNGNRLPDTPVAFRQKRVDERTLMNLRLVLDDAFGVDGLSLAAWGRNLTDDDHRTFSFNYGESIGNVVAQYGEPRTLGLDLVWEFRGGR